jgi:predicted membrane chloride channel (bestrophin family)
MESIKAVAELMTKALEKYPNRDNWKNIDNGEERYLNALLRHLVEIQEGKEFDSETKLPHAYAVGANALFYLYHYLKRAK